jgi:DegV family protein with EDD domain
MRKYVIVAESGADLPQEIVERHNIYVVQMHVEMDGRDYLDDSVSMEELVSCHKRTGKIPKTAGANPSQYAEIFSAIKEKHPDATVVHVCYSAQLSVCYQSALIADDGTIPVLNIDTKNVTAAQGFVVVKTAELIEKQPDIEPEELVAQVEAIVEKVRFIFVPGDIDYLRAGGRVSNAQYLGARLLRVKPLIEVKDGLMISAKKYSGSTKAIMQKVMTDYFEQYCIDKEKMYLG